ncbi:MAG: hypothetical protein ACLFPF_05310 [Halanaerobiales bacterium]
MKNINKLFSPIQGLARFVDYPALYQEIKPAKHLQEHIICYWAFIAIEKLIYLKNFNRLDEQITKSD